MLTPYQFASNRPIDGIDLDGLEWRKIETYNPKTGVTNVHFQVQLQIVNDSKTFKDAQTLKAEIKKQFKSAFDGQRNKNTTYSASIDVGYAENVPINNFSVVIDDFPKGLMKGFSAGEANTQNNSFTVVGGEYEGSDPSKATPRDTRSMAQDVVHELMHTANVKHPDDPTNDAQDVGLEPGEFKIMPNGVKKMTSYKLGPKASLKEVIQNVMLYNFKVVNGKKVTEYEKDKFKRNKVSPDQAQVAAEQIDKDTKKKQ